MTADKPYLVKEIFGPTLQGEGVHAGRACVFLRFAVCNLACSWCDTDFAAEGATKQTADEIVARLLEIDTHASRLVIVTGGEPSLQWDAPLAEAMAAAGFVVHMESNGTRALKAPVDWLTVSPKIQFHRKQDLLADTVLPNEVKLVVDDTVTGALLDELESRYPDAVWSVQPCDDANAALHQQRAIAFVTERPRWRLSIQQHKLLGLP